MCVLCIYVLCMYEEMFFVLVYSLVFTCIMFCVCHRIAYACQSFPFSYSYILTLEVGVPSENFVCECCSF